LLKELHLLNMKGNLLTAFGAASSLKGSPEQSWQAAAIS
jgi:hypothetical protein